MNQATRTPTAFESQVYGALGEIPRGRVATYAALAARLDCGSAQAVGQALKRNPFAPEVPCHRVIRSTDLFDTKYRWGTDRKLALIGWEQAQADAAAEPVRATA